MPKINVYLSDELAEAVKEAYLPVSAICQRALENAVRRVAAIREATVDGETTRQFSRFTARAQAVLALAEEDARGDGTAVGTHHLLAALVAEGGNLAVKLMPSMEIEPQEVTATVAARRPAPTGGDGPGGFADDAQAALRLAVTESTGLGHNYVGCEHVLIGLIAEPDGLGGQIMRGMGAELRLTRRAVAGALMGWAQRAQVEAESAPKDLATTLGAALRDQLAPIVTRLDQLERRLAGPA